ncbi:MAG: Uncharacterised protein [Methanobacteriota archaeon]|nr:MAG: Uncharacterised protein [Euryarchaeota archaeon]
MTKRSDRHLTIRIASNDLDALSSSLSTEPFPCTVNDGRVSVSIESVTTVDVRARWNTVMRALIGADEALQTIHSIEP